MEVMHLSSFPTVSKQTKAMQRPSRKDYPLAAVILFLAPTLLLLHRTTLSKAMLWAGISKE